ncbi:MAG TPA: glycosyltransferase family A protein [Bacteroidaceae bacterium]|nr:glycosyltransferase family A protein [Bacteroidaceae bacterium]
MLSILIPEFNWDCYLLVHKLWSQAIHLKINFEIIVADDLSNNYDILLKNRKINDLKYCSFIELEQSLGRASIRNWLADKSKYSTLLFLDCDARVESDNFIKIYLQNASLASVVCGGVIHPNELPSKGMELRYKYEKKADKKRTAYYRNKKKYSNFTTFSFLIDRKIFMSIKFDEKIKHYGYEDVIFGATLQEREVSIIHIDNPLIHLGIESNALFLEKTRESLISLLGSHDKIRDKSTLLLKYTSLKRAGFRPIILLFWRVFKKPINSNLNSSRPLLLLFSIYKLCYLSQIDKIKSTTKK